MIGSNVALSLTSLPGETTYMDTSSDFMVILESNEHNTVQSWHQHNMMPLLAFTLSEITSL